MDCEQLSLFPNEIKEDTDKNTPSKEEPRVSESIINSFSISPLPFLGCDFDVVYPRIASVLPKERIDYSSFPIEVMIRCEIICAGICHQMNWDFLREAVFQKACNSPNWVGNEYLISISSEEIAEMFKLYSKPERIRENERAVILHDIGEWLNKFENATSIFMNKKGDILDKESIREKLMSCSAFSNDPEEKKLQLLLQKLSMYSQFSSLSMYCEPAIDYHLIRCYLRRGLLYAKRKLGNDFISNDKSERKESTVAAIRQLCSALLKSICEYSDLDIMTVNQIEWYIGRSVCIQDNPDCFLQSKDTDWLKPAFCECPFINTCSARCYNADLLKINEPTYIGQSY